MSEQIESLLPTPFRKQGRQLEADGEVNVFCDMYCKEQMIEFAELIVRECLTLVEPGFDSGDEWCVTLKDTAQDIKEHFGVEE